MLAVDGATISTSGLEGLAPGQSRERCDWAPPFAAGRYTLTARVDADGAIPETNEANNEIQQEYVRTIADEVRAPGGSGATTSGANNGQPPPGPVANATTGPSPAPTTPAPRNSNANVDLTVSAIRVNGRVPDGKDDCQDGKNDVAVVVRNTGKADAGAVVVRLVVDKDDDRAANRTVNGLKADEEREVRFDDVRLKKGEHELEAIADAKEEVAESDEGNNARTVTAACKDED